jgi:hypothetical protein
MKDREHPLPVSKTSMMDHQTLVEGPVSIQDPKKCVITCMGSIDKSNTAHVYHFSCTWSCYVLRPLVGLQGMGYIMQHYLVYGYESAQGRAPSGPPILSRQR